MKTPEEIKNGLECCYSPVEPMQRCEACPYKGSIVCKMRLHTDALALIRQLEANDSQVKKALHDNGFGSLEEFLQAFSQVKAEREVMLQDMKHLAMGSDYCDTCKHGKSEIEAIICQQHDFCCKECSAECACKDCFGCTNWEWRGVQEQTEEE